MNDRRNSERINARNDYICFPGKNNEKISCTLKNISSSGACLVSDIHLKNNEIIFLTISGSKDVILKSKVLWKIKNEYGLLFILNSSQDFENISHVMNNEQKIINKLF